MFLLIALAIESDVARRWDEQWVQAWEAQNARPVDDLLDRLSRQVQRWRTARRLAFIYLVASLLVFIAVAGIQYKMSIMGPDVFRIFLLAAAGMFGLLLLPLMVGCEIGLNLMESMRRHLRASLGEKVVIHSRHELGAMPKIKKEKEKKDKPAK